VISRTSAFQYKGAKKDARTIGRELSVRYVLEGSVRKAGDELRITCQLIDANADAHLWAKKYSGTMADIFDLQERVARSVAETLALRLTGEEEQALGKIPVNDLRAYEYFLRAREQIHRFTVEALDRAVEYLERARSEVGENAAILSGLAYAYAQYVNLGKEQEEYIERAEGFARRALELDPDSGEACTVLGFIELWFKGRSLAAVRLLERAVVSKKDDAHALLWLSIAYAQVGKIQEARRAADRLLDVDPLTFANHTVAGAVELYAGRFEEALTSMERAFEGDPRNPMVQAFLALGLFYCGQHERLRTFVAEHADPDRASSPDLLMLLPACASAGDTDRMSGLLATPGSWETFRRDSQCSWVSASAFACAGDRDVALDWLGNAVERGFLNSTLLSQHDPFLATLRHDERFERIVERARRGAEGLDV
jgi:tetratricopeptide (TPR) repeat protein